mmetsp:Transcript_5135/g.9340  ORF Transcript_5135/g.9340 Transcript_5135/m.9340 type:complete len:336 (-) Transcript_5135:291-1298(-)
MAPHQVMGRFNFVAAMCLFWWSFVLSSAAYSVKWLDFKGKRNDIFQWAKFMITVTRTQIKLAGPTRAAEPGKQPIMYLANHRSWADFFVDLYLLGGRGVIMSRMAVFFAFPLFMAPVIVLKAILLFRRDIVRDKEKFNAWLDGKMKKSLLNGMLVYPEGHRNIKPEALPLKRGMLHYAYTRKMAVQVVITAGKERVLSEKEMSLGLQQTLVTGFSDVIDPTTFNEAKEFVAAVSQTFESEWKRVYGAAAQPELLPDFNGAAHAPAYDYPFSMRLGMVALLLFCGLGLGCTVLLPLKLCGVLPCVIFAFAAFCSFGHAYLNPPLGSPIATSAKKSQ